MKSENTHIEGNGGNECLHNPLSLLSLMSLSLYLSFSFSLSSPFVIVLACIVVFAGHTYQEPWGKQQALSGLTTCSLTMFHLLPFQPTPIHSHPNQMLFGCKLTSPLCIPIEIFASQFTHRLLLSRCTESLRVNIVWIVADIVYGLTHPAEELDQT